MDFRAMLKKKKYAKWGNDEDAPEWGDLKHVDEEEQVKLKKVEKVRFTSTLFYVLIEKYLKKKEEGEIEEKSSASRVPQVLEPPLSPTASCRLIKEKRNSLTRTPRPSRAAGATGAAAGEEMMDLRDLLRRTSLNPVRPQCILVMDRD